MKSRIQSWGPHGASSLPRPRKPMRQVSAKQAERARQLAALKRDEREAGFTDCEIRWPGVCTGRFEVWHHLRKRGQGRNDDRDNLVRSCWVCNRWVEDNPTEAKKRGLVR